MKVIITESQYNRAIDKFISYSLEPHEVKTSKNHPNSIYWIKGGEIITEIENSENFWLHIDIWDSISRMFELDYDGTQSVIKEWLEQHHNLGELTPATGRKRIRSWLELHYNLGELTPVKKGYTSHTQLELHYNLG